MTKKHYFFFKKKWPIVLRYNNRMLYIQVSPDVGIQIVLEMFKQIYEDYKLMMFSQYIDTRICDVGDKQIFINRIEDMYPVKVSLTTNYSEGAKPSESARSFVVNIAGSLEINLLQELIKFDMQNLSYILYGSGSKIDDWQDKLLKWNDLIVKWFRLQLEENKIVELVNEIGPIALSIDGNVFICITQISQLNRLFTILNQLSNKHGYLLNIKIRTMNRKN
jgi:hypothetical protein